MTLKNSALLILLGLVYFQDQADDFPPEIETYTNTECEESESSTNDNNHKCSSKKKHDKNTTNNKHKHTI